MLRKTIARAMHSRYKTTVRDAAHFQSCHSSGGISPRHEKKSNANSVHARGLSREWKEGSPSDSSFIHGVEQNARRKSILCEHSRAPRHQKHTLLVFRLKAGNDSSTPLIAETQPCNADDSALGQGFSKVGRKSITV